MHGYPLTSLQHKLRVLRKALRTWNWEVFGDVHRRVDTDLADLVSLQHDISISGGSDADYAKECELQANLSESLRLQELFWKEKSRLRWLSEGDRNTRFFHTICRARRTRSSITLLRDGNQVFQDPLAVQNHIVDYYTKLFTNHADYIDTGLIGRVIPSLVTDAENGSLTAIPSSEEISLAVKDMDPDSAPGLDGFNGHFFISCWQTVGADVTD